MATYDYFSVRPIWQGNCVGARLIVENGTNGDKAEIVLTSEDIRMLIDSLKLNLAAMGETYESMD